MKKLSIEEMQEIAKQRGGKCLSDTYVNAQRKLLWECSEGHQWEAVPNSVKSGTWCGKCAVKDRAEKQRGTIEEMQKIADERGGKCLSDYYANARTKLLWECAEGHKWKATPYKIKNGQWCNECSSGLGERICREFFRQIFCKEFPKSHPKWLINKEGNQMELDGYCETLSLAFEHHGEQHYSVKTRFIKTKKKLIRRQEDDRLKRGLCKQHNIVLIEVPEIPSMLSIEDVKAYIKKELEVNVVPLPFGFDTKKINLKKAYTTSRTKEALKEMRNIAKERGGKCLSDTYVNAHRKLLWKCSEGHQWEATPNNIKRGKWCKKCSDSLKGISQRLSIEMMQEIAIQRGGKCLSDTYINSKTKILWECADGHKWKAIPESIKRGNWCKKCADKVRAEKRKGTIEEMQKIADERGGKCLSDTYVNSSTNLLWECAKKHRWKATPSNIKSGKWCKKCYIARKAKKQ